jgi:Cd2+/Zn2+-exporting ATPase
MENCTCRVNKALMTANNIDVLKEMDTIVESIVMVGIDDRNLPVT